MKFFFVLIISVIFHQQLFSQSIFERWHKTDQLIRDRNIDEDDAIDSIKLYVKLGKAEFKQYGIAGTKRSDWVFPMSDFTWYSYRADGKDYKDDRFSYFQGGEFKGHPAHDVFILDKDTNSLEDSTGKHVPAISMVNGIVISTYDSWFRQDYLRSGNYIKLFDPESEAMFYYSHLDSVFVKPGDFVKAGDKIGYIGRTGRKAIYGKTHIHIAYYKIEDGEPIPEDILNDLYRSQSRMKKD